MSHHRIAILCVILIMLISRFTYHCIVVLYTHPGVVNNDLLYHLAAELGDEWHQLAENLDVKRGRLAAILRNNVNHPAEAIYEMLVTWAKQVPLATSTVGKGELMTL